MMRARRCAGMETNTQCCQRNTPSPGSGAETIYKVIEKRKQIMAANNKRKNELQFKLTEDDIKLFGRYRILYTKQGHRMVLQQRLTYLISAAALAVLFTVFHVDKKFTIMMYITAAVIAFVGIFFAETLVIRQQDREIAKTESSAERVHAVTNTVRLEEEGFSTFAAGDEQHFKYTDIKLVDLTDHAIYVWLSDEMIMPLPLHAFRDLKDMKETCKWIREKAGLNE